MTSSKPQPPRRCAAALEPNVFRTVTVRNMPRTWEELVGATESRDQAVNVLHGPLPQDDLPDLVEMAGAFKVGEGATFHYALATKGSNHET